MTRITRWAVVALLAALAGCGSGAPEQPVIPGADTVIPPAGTTMVYAAIGASETVGIGSDDPFREGWTQVFYETAFTRATTMYNYGVPGTVAAQALDQQVPSALAVHATVATVFLGVNDMADGITAADYAQALDGIVSRLRTSGARVLVANIPVLDSLPALAACRRGGSGPVPPAPPGLKPLTGAAATFVAAVSCPAPAFDGQSNAVIDATVAAYNTQIAAVAARNGAVLVDLHALGDQVRTDPGLISDDGFHPSDRGHRLLGGEFAATYKRS